MALCYEIKWSVDDDSGNGRNFKQLLKWRSTNNFVLLVSGTINTCIVTVQSNGRSVGLGTCRVSSRFQLKPWASCSHTCAQWRGKPKRAWHSTTHWSLQGTQICTAMTCFIRNTVLASHYDWQIITELDFHCIHFLSITMQLGSGPLQPARAPGKLCPVSPSRRQCSV